MCCCFLWNFWWVVLVTFWGFKNATTTTDHSPAHSCAPFIYPSYSSILKDMVPFHVDGIEYDWMMLNGVVGPGSFPFTNQQPILFSWFDLLSRCVWFLWCLHHTQTASKVGDRPEKLPLPTSFQLLHLIHILLGRPCATPFDLSISSKLTTKEKAPKLISAEKTDQNQCSSAVQSKGSARNWCVHERQLDFRRC